MAELTREMAPKSRTVRRSIWHLGITKMEILQRLKSDERKLIVGYVMSRKGFTGFEEYQSEKVIKEIAGIKLRPQVKRKN